MSRSPAAAYPPAAGPVSPSDAGGPPPAAPTSDECRRLLEDQIAVVAGAVHFIALRYRLTVDAAEDLRGRAHLHLVDRDFAVLKAWRRECQLQTYLVTVVARLFLDDRKKEWGRLRLPAAVRRGGPVALQLWQLVRREGHSFDQAVEALRTEHGVQDSRESLWELYNRFPPHPRRRVFDIGRRDEWEQPGAEADRLVTAEERGQLDDDVDAALASALDTLGDEDRLILTLSFRDGATTAQIARLLGLSQARLYPRVKRLLATLKTALQARGVGIDDVAEVAGSPETGKGRALRGRPQETPDARSSL